MKESDFVPAATQCPQKPRGRKKGKKAALPPIASQPDMSNQPEKETTAKKRRTRTKKDDNTSNQPEQKTTTKTKGTKSTKADSTAVPDTSNFSRPSAAACGFSTEGMTDSQVKEKLNSMSCPDPEPTPKRRKGNGKGTRKGKRGLPKPSDNEAEEMKEVPAKVAKKTKIPASVEATVTRDAKPKAKAKATAKNKGKPRSRKTASRNASSSGSAPSGTMTARANHAAGANHAAANDDNGEVDGAPETPPTGPTADEIRKAENKKRLSRKSSAYHKAALKAKKQGLTKEEIAAVGKAVSWIIYVFARCKLMNTETSMPKTYFDAVFVNHYHVSHTYIIDSTYMH